MGTQARAAAGGDGAAFGTGAVAHAMAVLPKAADALAGALAAAAHDDAAAVAAAAADWPQRPAAEELVVLELAVLNVLGGKCNPPPFCAVDLDQKSTRVGLTSESFFAHPRNNVG